MTPKEHGRLHRFATVVSAGRWVAVKAAEKWFGQLFQASSCFKVKFSLNWRWKCLARSSYAVSAARPWSSPMCKVTKRVPAAGRRAIWGPSPGPQVQVMKPTACSSWAEAGLTALYGWASFLVGRFSEKRQLNWRT